MDGGMTDRCKDLENRYGRFTSIEGSNPPPAARQPKALQLGVVGSASSASRAPDSPRRAAISPRLPACRPTSRSHADRTKDQARWRTGDDLSKVSAGNALLDAEPIFPRRRGGAIAYPLRQQAAGAATEAKRTSAAPRGGLRSGCRVRTSRRRLR